MVQPNRNPASPPAEMLPGMEDMFPPLPDSEAVLAAQGIVAARSRANAEAQSASRIAIPVDYDECRAEVRVDQGVASEAIAHDRIQLTDMQDVPRDKQSQKQRKPKAYQERSGRDHGRDLANAEAETNPTGGRPMSRQMRAVKAALLLEADLRKAAGDPRLAAAYQATRDHRTET